MMKRVKLLIISIIYCFIFTAFINVNAKQYSLEEIPDGAYIIGTHMFSSSLSPETSPFYSGLIDSSTVMLGSSTIDTSGFESSKDFVIYYKIIEDIWLDSITGSDITPPEDGFEITHVNGECVDPSCMGNAISVKFLANAGLEDVFETKTINVEYGEKISAAEIPTLNNRPGYKFTCWTMKDSDECFDLDTPITNELLGEEEELVLETKWEQINYKITYNNNFDETTEIRECTYGNVGNEEINCSFAEYDSLFGARENYIFAGWSTTPDGDTLYNESTDMGVILGDSENITLYAIWKTVSYKVTYDLNGGTFSEVVSPQTTFTTEDESITLPNVNKVGYNFVNWTYDGEEFDGNDLPNKDITIKANWKPITYSFVYESDRVECTYDVDCTIDITPENVPEGREFNKWYINDTSKIYIGNKVKNFTTTDKKEFTLVPEYELIKYYITYDLDGGILEEENVNSYTYDSIELSNNKNITLNVPNKVGYDFAGWEVIKGTGLSVRSNTEVVIVGASDVTLKAKWNEKTYTIQYYNDDAMVENKNCTYTNCIVNAHDVTKEDYVFIGWKSESTGLVYSKDSLISSTDLVDEVVKLDAKWTNEYRYTIAYDLDGGKFAGEAPVSYMANEEVLLPTPTKEGYKFAGWLVDDEELDGNRLIGYSKDVKLKAQWVANTYTIKFNMTGKSIPEVVCTYDKDCSFGDHSSYVAENMKLLGWAKISQGSIYYGDNLVVKNLTNNDKDVINLYAVLEDITVRHNVSYYLDGGELTSGIINNTYVDGEKVTLPEPTKEGYKFAGWYDVNSSSIIESGTAIKKDWLLVAKWEILTYKITYVDSLGEDLLVDGSYPTSYAYGVKEIIIPKLPDGVISWKVLGTELNKYFLNGDETSSYVINVSNYGDIEVVGELAPKPEPVIKKYEVSLYDEDTLLGVLLVEENDTIISDKTVFKDIEYEGYKEMSWNDSEGEPFDIESTTITENINLYLVKDNA